jgi:uncharacterized protein (TIGR03083 family)
MSTRLPFARYLEHLVTESELFAAALVGVPANRPVPTCPDWTALDLAYHLTEVQSFWTAVVSGPLLTRDQVQQVQTPECASTLEHQVDDLRSASAALAAALAAIPPATPAYTWSAEQTVGFTFRRQALEALVHRLDAQLTAGVRTAMDPQLCTDGVDEALRVMFGGCPPWGRITPTGGPPVRLVARDTGYTWLVSPARFTGTDTDGVSHDEPDIFVAEADSDVFASASITATAEDLLCWLWSRPTVAPVEQAGDEAARSAITQVLEQPIT